MSSKITITFGVCVAAGIAFGIGLARPGNQAAPTAAGAAVGTAPAATVAAPTGGYGQAATPAAPAGGGAVAAPAAAATGTVTIADFAFGSPLTVAPGATLTVANADSAAHTLTADDGSFDTGTINGGATASVAAPAAPGTYEFFCTIHPSMRGSISIQG